MKKQALLWFLAGVSIVLSGCVVRSYPLTRDRVDQSLSAGNRGYLQGQAPAGEMKERKSTRTTQVVEVELRSPFKFEKAPKAKAESSPMMPAEQETEGNMGYITSSVSAEEAGPAAVEKYTVQKNDTLQKISNKFYGTTKLWKWIYDANADILKSPNSIYPGQVIKIPPMEGKVLKGAGQNLK